MRAENPSPCLLDSNIWLYAFVEQGEPQKQTTAKQLLEQPAVVISTQIINEVCFNLRRKADFTEEQIRRLIYSFYLRYSVTALDQTIMLAAAELRSRYSFSFWDNLVVAAALHAGCKLLYTEDMQHGLFVDERLRILNPFAAFSVST